MSSKKFIILSTPRTGSSYLVYLLESHVDMNCYHELFNLNRQKKDPKFDQSYQRFFRETLAKRVKQVVNSKGSLDDYLKSMQSKDSTYFGFKIMVKHAEYYKGLISLLKEGNYRVIMLRRRNVLKQFISLEHAVKFDLWATEKKPDFQPQEVLKANLIRNLNDLERDNLKMNKWFQNQEHIEIYYEDLVGPDSSIVQQNICQFLELRDDCQLKSPLKKIMDDRLEKILVNHKEVCHWLEGTKFEKYLKSNTELDSFHQ